MYFGLDEVRREKNSSNSDFEHLVVGRGVLLSNLPSQSVETGLEPLGNPSVPMTPAEKKPPCGDLESSFEMGVGGLVALTLNHLFLGRQSFGGMKTLLQSW